MIPAYNAQKWIAQTIQSALAQSWTNKEIIVVDDGSTDTTLAIAQFYAAKAVKIVGRPNLGASAARNHAFSLAQGDYIQWLDADDLLAPDKIERQMTLIQHDDNPRLLYSGAWGRFFYRTTRAEFLPTALWADLTPVDWLCLKMEHNLQMQPDSWLVSRALTETAGPWDATLWRDNDGEYFCRVLSKSAGVRFVPEAKSYYRRSGSSSISYIGTSQKKIESLFRSINLHVQYLRSLEDSVRTRKVSVAFLRTWLVEFYPEREDLLQRFMDLARELGQELPTPVLRRKYRPLESLLGVKSAKAVQRLLPLWKENGRRLWDFLMWKLELTRQPTDRPTR